MNFQYPTVISQPHNAKLTRRRMNVHCTLKLGITFKKQPNRSREHRPRRRVELMLDARYLKFWILESAPEVFLHNNQPTDLLTLTVLFGLRDATHIDLLH